MFLDIVSGNFAYSHGQQTRQRKRRPSITYGSYTEYYACVTLYSYVSYLRRSGWGHKSPDNSLLFLWPLLLPCIILSPYFYIVAFCLLLPLVPLFVSVTTFIFFALLSSRSLRFFRHGRCRGIGRRQRGKLSCNLWQFLRDIQQPGESWTYSRCFKLNHFVASCVIAMKYQICSNDTSFSRITIEACQSVVKKICTLRLNTKNKKLSDTVIEWHDDYSIVLHYNLFSFQKTNQLQDETSQLTELVELLNTRQDIQKNIIQRNKERFILSGDKFEILRKQLSTCLVSRVNIARRISFINSDKTWLQSSWKRS